MDRAHQAEKPFFVWFNSTRMHVFTHLKPGIAGKTGQGLYADGMANTTDTSGSFSKKLDDLGIADNTIVMYSTDNGAELLLWPDGGYTPFRGEKNSNWEGGYRVPMLVRWPAQIPAGRISNEMISHQDWLPTLLAAAGEPDIKGKLKQGMPSGSMTYKVHLDGYNFLPHFKGESAEGPRQGFHLRFGYGRHCCHS